MKQEEKAAHRAKPVVVWESGGRRQSGQVIPFHRERPGSGSGQGAAEQEATVLIRQVGSEAKPAIVTQVSSGFSGKRSAGAGSQTLHMRLAA